MDASSNIYYGIIVRVQACTVCLSKVHSSRRVRYILVRKTGTPDVPDRFQFEIAPTPTNRLFSKDSHATIPLIVLTIHKYTDGTYIVLRSVKTLLASLVGSDKRFFLFFEWMVSESNAWMAGWPCVHAGYCRGVVPCSWEWVCVPVYFNHLGFEDVRAINTFLTVFPSSTIFLSSQCVHKILRLHGLGIYFRRAISLMLNCFQTSNWYTEEFFSLAIPSIINNLHISFSPTPCAPLRFLHFSLLHHSTRMKTRIVLHPLFTFPYGINRIFHLPGYLAP